MLRLAFCVVLLAVATAASLPCAAQAAVAADGLLKLDKGIRRMAYTEDGRHLIILHSSENLVSIVDMANFTLLAKYRVATPEAVLCRGDRVFVANGEKGTITVLSAKAKFRPVDQLDVAEGKVTSVCAPAGKEFTGTLIVGCEAADREGRALAVYAVDADKDRSRLLADKLVANKISVDARGRLLVAGGTLYDLPALLDQQLRLSYETDGADSFGQFYTSLWGTSSTLGGNHRRGLEFEDATQPVVYGLRREQQEVTLQACTGVDLHDLPEVALKLPQSLIATPLAATVDGKLHLVFHASDDSLIHMETPAVKLDASATAPADGMKLSGRTDIRHMFPSLDDKSVYAHCQGMLLQLDAQTAALQRAIALPSPYARLHERRDYWVALGIASVDLLDKKDFSVVKRIPLPQPYPAQLVCDDQGAFSYVSVRVPQAVMSHSPLLAVVDEAAGTARLEPGIFAGLIVKPAGEPQLMVAGSNWDADFIATRWGMYHRDRLDTAAKFSYYKPGEPLKFLRQDKDFQPQSSMFASPDGRLLVSQTQTKTVTTADGSRDVTEVQVRSWAKLKEPFKTVLFQGRIESRCLSFSPSGKYLLACNGLDVAISSVSTGRPVMLDFKRPKTAAVQIAGFSADEKRLIVLLRYSNMRNERLQAQSIEIKEGK